MFAALVLALLSGSGCDPAPAPTAPAGLRLVSTAPHLTEAVFAAGAGHLLVARPDCCDYPPEVRVLPVVGGFGTPWHEPLLAVRPTHLLESVMADPGMRQHLASFGIAITHIPCDRLNQITEALRQIGALAGTEAVATARAAAIDAALTRVRATLPDHNARPRVLTLFAPGAPVTSGRRAFVSDLLELAGGINLGSAQATPYYRVSLEWIVQQAPDLLICLYDTGGRDPAQRLGQQSGWQTLQAVRCGRVYQPQDLDTISRPGPRVLEGLSQFQEILMRDARHRRRTESASDRESSTL